ncbi:MAG: glycerol-3-phosphate dehydrogenase [Clostridiales bacterium GWF2_36_10]|nr:MAG: glycerol-3-phosphate dehydrogenase [Clostridiales bacterium GWF2_36_10]HAN20559.1 glycerol-3-phosphate dehydrogenase [Clostridiales bacterium]
MNITVVGCGRWGVFLAWYLYRCGNNVYLYGRSGSQRTERLIKERTNGTVTLTEYVTVGSDLQKAISNEIIVIAVASQGLRELMQKFSDIGFSKKTFVLCMKGLEVTSNKRLTEIVNEYIDGESRVAVWIGPGHVEDFLRGIPNCMVIDSESEETKELLAETFSSDLIRFYYGNDLIGNEIGAAAKNVIGIAAGMLDGMGLTSLKGGLMSRGTREIARLISAMGGNEFSAYGLCHLGDYEATLFSPHSHNRRYGEAFVKGQNFEELAEGCYAVKALISLAERKDVELPICQAVYSVLYEKKDAAETMKGLFSRSRKKEF